MWRFFAEGNNGLSLTGFEPMRLAILRLLVRCVNHSTRPPVKITTWMYSGIWLCYSKMFIYMDFFRFDIHNSNMFWHLLMYLLVNQTFTFLLQIVAPSYTKNKINGPYSLIYSEIETNLNGPETNLWRSEDDKLHRTKVDTCKNSDRYIIISHKMFTHINQNDNKLF